MLEILLFLGFFALLLASLHDIKTKEVPDYLSYVFISLGILVQIFYLVQDFDFARSFMLFCNAAFAFVFGTLMYYKKQWGGADAKLLIGLSFFLSGQENKWFFAHYFLNFLLVGAVYGIAGSVFLIVKNLGKFKEILRDNFKKFRGMYLASFGTLFAGLIISFFNPLGIVALIIGALALVSLALSNTNKLMIKKVGLEKLTEGDWVVNKVVVKGKVLFNPEKEIDIRKSHLEKFKEAGVKSVKIIDGMPFVPAFLIAYLLTIVKNDFFVELVRVFVFQAF